MSPDPNVLQGQERSADLGAEEGWLTWEEEQVPASLVTTHNSSQLYSSQYKGLLHCDPQLCLPVIFDSEGI